MTQKRFANWVNRELADFTAGRRGTSLEAVQVDFSVLATEEECKGPGRAPEFQRFLEMLAPRLNKLFLTHVLSEFTVDAFAAVQLPLVRMLRVFGHKRNPRGFKIVDFARAFSAFRRSFSFALMLRTCCGIWL